MATRDMHLKNSTYAENQTKIRWSNSSKCFVMYFCSIIYPTSAENANFSHEATVIRTKPRLDKISLSNTYLVLKNAQYLN